ncbi:hypothetical protein BC332_01074 [Capsicum chinense]|nr:hypothetical protein BC332_01074 [Capsicum chinense]
MQVVQEKIKVSKFRRALKHGEAQVLPKRSTNLDTKNIRQSRLGSWTAISRKDNLRPTEVDLLAIVRNKAIKDTGDGKTRGSICLSKQGQSSREKKGIEGKDSILDILLIVYPNTILIEGLNTIFPPPINSNVMEEFGVLVPLYKPVNSRFKHPEIRFIPEKGLVVLKKLLLKRFSVKLEGFIRIMDPWKENQPCGNNFGRCDRGGNGNGGGGGIQPSGVAKALYSAARISVWQDIENSQVPRESDPHSIAQNISTVLVNVNYCGPFSIFAYGDTIKISAFVQQVLNSTGIGLDHVLQNPKSISLVEVNDLNSPAFWDKNKAANPKRFTKVPLLKAQRTLGCIPSMANSLYSSFASVKKRIVLSNERDEDPKYRGESLGGAKHFTMDLYGLALF